MNGWFDGCVVLLGAALCSCLCFEYSTLHYEFSSIMLWTWLGLKVWSASSLCSLFFVFCFFNFPNWLNYLV